MGRRRDTAAAAAHRLTEAQKQCLRLVYRHMTSKEIAPLLDLSPHSVDAHIRLAMKVLGVDSRREAAVLLNMVEAEKSAHRKPVAMDYRAADAPQHAHVGEEHVPAWTYYSDRSDMAASQDHSKNESAMVSLVGQSGLAGAFFSSASKGDDSAPASKLKPAEYTVKQKIIIILISTLLSAISFSAIVSGLAALSILLKN